MSLLTEQTAAASERKAPSRRRWSGLQIALFAVPLVILAWTGLAHRFIFDDGYIYLRVIKQIRVGNGPVFNAGQRVEAFTSPAWVFILAMADLLTPISLQWLAVLLGVGCSVAGAAFAMRTATIITRRAAPDALMIPLGVLVFAALLPVWYFESAGLETGLTFLWFGFSGWLLANWAGDPHRRLSALAAVALGLGWLIRPELIVASAVFLVTVSVLQWDDSTWRQRVELVAWMIALPVAYQIFRMGYYGALVSNTAIAKEGSRLRVGTGWNYLLDFLAPYRLWFPIVLLIGAVYVPLALQLRRQGEQRSVWVLVAFLISAFGCAAGVIGFGGDYLHARLLLPAFFALCTPVAVVAATKRFAVSFVVLGWALICAIAFRPPELRTGVHYRAGIPYGFPTKSCCGDLTLASSGWGSNSKHLRQFDDPTVYVSDQLSGYGTSYVRMTTPPAAGLHLPTVVSGGIGALGYAVGPRVNILDINGLADPVAAHLKLVRRGYPGHEKSLPAPWAAALVTADNTVPRANEFKLKDADTTPSNPTLPFLQQVSLARTALQCSSIRELRQSTTRPMSFGTFISNFIHSFGRTKMRIPSDPKAAVNEFCGGHALTVVRSGAASVGIGQSAVATMPARTRAGSDAYAGAPPLVADARARFGSTSGEHLERAPP